MHLDAPVDPPQAHLPTNPPTRPLSAAWGLDERRYNRNHAEEGRIPVFTCSVRECALSREEIMSRGTDIASTDIRNMYEKCFGGNASMLDRAHSIIEKSQAETSGMDPFVLDELFRVRVVMMESAMDSVRRDVGLNDQHKTEMMNASRSIITMMIRLNDLLISTIAVQKTSLAAISGLMVSDADASWRYMPEKTEKLNAMQRLYTIAFNKAHQMQYARYKDGFMRRIITADGFITNAWERVKSFQEFMYELTLTPTGEIQFLSTKGVNMMEDVAKLLGKKRESDLPWLKPDRRVFAFRTGCYICKDETFITFSKDSPPSMPDGTQCPTACKFHDCVVDLKWIDCDDYMDIPTPLMSLIMNTQELNEDVKRMYFAMLGRSIYDLGEFDNWQTFLFVKGAAETGKSTLLKFVASFYNTEDVGVLSNNIESTFGPSMIAEKFVVVGDDLGENFTLDQQLFQNMSSGNDVSLPIKGKGAMVLKWTTQLLLSGNVLPDYKDNSGSFSRRLIIIHYAKPVRHVDPTIPERLKSEMGAAIIKCNRAYRNTVRRLKYLLERDENPLTFWDAIPEEFRIQKNNVMQIANPIMSFLRAGSLVFGPSLYMPKQVFLQQLMTHCYNHGIPKPKFQPAQYDGSFLIMELRMENAKKSRKYPRGDLEKNVMDSWIIGCDSMSAETLAIANADLNKTLAIASVDEPPVPAPAAPTAIRKRPTIEPMTDDDYTPPPLPLLPFSKRPRLI